MKQLDMKQKILSSTIAALIGTMSSGLVLAQEESVEEIVVSGIRKSLERAMDIKKESSGVVDAISAEDIGKFPDSNLAESLQRITGVSIDRQNNEGSKVTVRGFGPDYNMITLNGRQMPAANLQATSASNSRSYDFANLAAESVSGVEVYKTGKANLNTGGIGSTINIKTARPLKMDGMQASVGIKAVNDTSTRIGDEVTPEISGIYSDTFADNTFGVAVSGSFQERNSSYNAAEVSSGWNSSQLDADTVAIVPQNFMYSFNDVERKRTNGQVTLQWAPTDVLTTTADYTYSELDMEQQRQEASSWFGSGAHAGTEWYEATSDGVVSPKFLNNNDCCEIGFGTGAWGTINEGKSIGLNLEWQASDALTLALDYHDSSAEAKPKDSRGSNNVATVGGYTRTNTTVDFSSDIPVMKIMTGAGNLSPDMLIATGTSHRNGYMKTDIEQLQLDGKYAFDNSVIKSIDFGLSNTEMNNRSAFSLNQGGNWGGLGYTFIGGDWNAGAGDGDGNFNNNAFTYAPVSKLISSLPDDAGVYGDMLWVDYEQFSSDIANFYLENPTGQGAFGNVFANCVPGTLCTDPVYSVDRRLEEEQTAIYLQTNLGFDIGVMPTTVNLGLRYEKTDVASVFILPNYVKQEWLTPNEIQLLANGSNVDTGKGSYANWLPNIDFSLAITDDVLIRSSISKTIARPNYQQLQGGAAPDGSQARSFDASSASAGDTDLDPFESTNFDLSAEWYYSDSSYVSLGYYKKDVKNFIGTTVYQEVIYPGLVNPASGARLAEAAAAVVDPNNRNQEIRNYFVTQGWVTSGGVITGDHSVYDPLSFTVTAPVNQKEASIDGFEFAVQHMFGESGFGGIINYTTVDGDISYDNSLIRVDQFALLGMSDSANVVAFYDKHGIQVRIAYNWRDKFLSATTGGNNQQEPAYTEAYGQVDLSVSYELTENLTLQFEGINITEEDTRVHARSKNAVIFAAEQEARFALGARYKF
ncbi:MAG: TonB-dependent receptor [Pseudomonadota bacterium]